MEINQDTGVIRANNNIVLLDDSNYRLLKPDKRTQALKRNHKGPKNVVKKKICQLDFDYMPMEARAKVYWLIVAGLAILV